MSSTVFEIIELDDGEYVLQRTDEEGDPLVSIRFSGEALAFLGGNSVDIVKTMFEAGLHQVEDIMDEKISGVENSLGQRIIH